MTLPIPAEVEAVFREFRTCEFSTLAADGTPISWPMLPFYRVSTGEFMTTTSIGLPDKAINIRRNPHVSLLFSDATGSGLFDTPAVLVQGDAAAPDEIKTSIGGFQDEIMLVYRRQPAGAMYTSNAAMRWFSDWYFMRLEITVTPRRILWWEHGDLSSEPKVAAAVHVG